MPEPAAGQLTVEDRLDIMDLLVRYAWAMDARDADGFAAVFAPQGVWSPSTGTGGTGPEAIREAFRSRIQAQSPNRLLRHLAGPPIIQGDAQRCSVRSLCQVVEQTPDGSCAIRQVAEYHDTCVNLDGRWRFEQKVVKTVLDGRGIAL
jgi:uncharacterized protein (TIGR02246 family)